MRFTTLATAITLAFASGAAGAANGDLDTSFGSGGLRSLAFDLGGSKADRPQQLVRLSDGGYLAVGRAATAAGTDDAVAAKVSANGIVDFGFATLGKYHNVQTFDADLDQAFLAAAQTPDGRIALVGFGDKVFSGVHLHQALFVRLSASGQQLFDFVGGEAGITREFTGAAVDPLGRVMVSGVYQPQQNTPTFDGFYARRYFSDNSVDASYALSGESIVPFGGGYDVATAVVALPDGSIVQGGFTQLSGADYDFALAHVLASGDLDDGGNLGKDSIAFDLAGSSKTDKVRAIATDAQGRLLIGGEIARSADGSDTDIALIRLKADLSLDTSFGTSGKLVLSYDLLDVTRRDTVGAIAVAPDGKILIVGTHYTGDPANVSDVALVRLKDDGNADLTFGTFGRELYDFGQGATHADEGVGVAIDGDRAVVLAKREFSGADTDFLLFGVQSAQLVKPDPLFKDNFE